MPPGKSPPTPATHSGAFQNARDHVYVRPEGPHRTRRERYRRGLQHGTEHPRARQPRRHLDKVEPYLGQVCQIAGISKMQLDYWTNKAQIPTKGKKQRIYDIEALETVMLIKQAKDKGLNLGAAIDAARRFRAAEQPRLAGSSSRRRCRRPCP